MDLKLHRFPLHQSSIADYLHCPRLFYYKHRLCLVPKRRVKSPTAYLGSLVHKLLAKPSKDQWPEVLDRLQERKDELAQQAASEDDLFGNAADELKILTETIDKASAMAEIFMEQFSTPSGVRVLATEQYLDQTLDLERPVRLAGIVDAVWEDTEQDSRIWIVDHKTTSRMIEDTVAGYQFSLQAQVYRLLVESWLGRAAAGFVLNVLRIPSIRPCNKDKDPETRQVDLNLYLQRVRDWYLDKGKEAATRCIIWFRGPAVSPEFKQVLLRAQEAMDAEEVAEEDFCRDVTCRTCSEYGRTCPYLPLCAASDEKSKQGILAGQYDTAPEENHAAVATDHGD